MAIYRRGPSHPTRGPPPRSSGSPPSLGPPACSLEGAGASSGPRGALAGAGRLSVHAHPRGLDRRRVAGAPSRLNRALQAGGGQAGRGAGRGAARQAAGQGVAGRGAAGARAPEQLRAEAGVAARVLGQVVAAGEALGAEGAGEALLPRVRPVVAGQLVRARELLVAARPVASKGALTWTEETEDRERSVVGMERQGEGGVPPDP